MANSNTKYHNNEKIPLRSISVGILFASPIAAQLWSARIDETKTNLFNRKFIFIELRDNESYISTNIHVLCTFQFDL